MVTCINTPFMLTIDYKASGLNKCPESSPDSVPKCRSNAILVEGSFSKSALSELGLCMVILVCTTSKYKLCWIEIGIRRCVPKEGTDEPVLICYSCSVVVFGSLFRVLPFFCLPTFYDA